MRILIVEDNDGVAATLGTVIERSYRTDRCSRLDDAIYYLSVGSYGVIVLDLVLEDGDGIELCRYLRKRRDLTPVLVLSGRHDETSRVELLDAGADDYLVKPFAAAELMARIRSLLRRKPSHDGLILGSDELMLDPARRIVIRRGVEIVLRRKEFSVLEFLMRHPRQVITRHQLLEQIWDYSGEITNNTVDVHIKYLRDHIDRPFGTATIKTVHGVGYRFVIPEVTLTK